MALKLTNRHAYLQITGLQAVRKVSGTEYLPYTPASRELRVGRVAPDEMRRRCARDFVLPSCL